MAASPDGWTDTYDALDPLTSADNASGTAADEIFIYSLAGNLTFKTGNGYYTYPAPGPSAVRPHAALTIGLLPAFTYDANGNLLTGAGRSFVWDGENRPASITIGAVTSTFVYGPDGARLKKLTPANPRGCTTAPSPLPVELLVRVRGRFMEHVCTPSLGTKSEHSGTLHLTQRFHT